MFMMMLVILSILVSLGFFTLIERKLLSLSQMRLGPNKTSSFGLIQPILDGVKLFKKLNILNLNIITMMFFFTSLLLIMFSFMLWMAIPFLYSENKIMVMMWLILLFGIMSYCILMMGWSSMSKFSFFGFIRSLAQSLSFEINGSLLLMLTFLLKNKMSISIKELNSFIFLSLMLLFFMLILIECQRAPMDLSEGESELVSGYNTEYSSVMFTFIFLGEYSVLLMLSLLMTLIFLKNVFFIILYLILMIRSCYPRMRYDMLMEFSWYYLLPINIILWFLYYNSKIFN